MATSEVFSSGELPIFNTCHGKATAAEAWPQAADLRVSGFGSEDHEPKFIPKMVHNEKCTVYTWNPFKG